MDKVEVDEEEEDWRLPPTNTQPGPSQPLTQLIVGVEEDETKGVLGFDDYSFGSDEEDKESKTCKKGDADKVYTTSSDRNGYASFNNLSNNSIISDGSDTTSGARGGDEKESPSNAENVSGLLNTMNLSTSKSSLVADQNKENVGRQNGVGPGRRRGLRGGRGKNYNGDKCNNSDAASSSVEHDGYPSGNQIHRQSISRPIFCSGTGKVLNKKKQDINLLSSPSKIKISNRERIKTAENLSMESRILKEHVKDMEILMKEIEKLRASEGFHILDDNKVGTLKAMQAQFHEMVEQYNIFQVKSQTCHSFGDEGEAKKQIQREIYRFKGRLPALAKRSEIEKHIDSFPKSGRFLIIQGQTGSGKSTQIPQYLADHPKFRNKRIVCTQPRKIAALSLAQRVSIEYSGGESWARPGRNIGYQIGGQKVKGKRIEFVTEGVMLDRIMSGSDKPFKDVGCIVIDEAHERSVICDILLGSFKKPDPRWKDALIVVTSATIDLLEFSSFFDNAPMVEMEGRMFPIEIFYHPIPDSVTSDLSLIRKEVVERALNIHASCGPMIGDILCFLPGQEDVLNAKDDLEWELKKLPKPYQRGSQLESKVYALFGKQDPEQQQEVFEILPKGIRKIVFATDVAETSITIDGVVYVVDSGVRKEMMFDPKRNISTLKLTTISKSSATQRAGRSGRTQAGECHRLYSEFDYLSMSPTSAPEVFRKPLSLAVLSLIQMKIVPNEFEWINSPSKDALLAAEEELHYLGAIDKDNKMTELGNMISQCQQEPKLVRLIYRGCQDGFGMASVTIASIFTVANMFFYRGNEDGARQESRKAKNSFALESGDVVTMFRVFQKYLEVLSGASDKDMEEKSEPDNEDDRAVEVDGRKRDSNGRKRAGEWCRKNFVNGKAIGLIISTRKELLQLFRPSSVWKQQLVQNREPSDMDLRRIVFSGYFLHTARLIHTRKSRIPQYFAIHPSVPGSLDNKSAVAYHTTKNKTENASVDAPEWIVYEKILRLNTTLFPTSTPIDFAWVEQESPDFLSLCLAKQGALPTEKVLMQTSQECLRKLFGKYFIHMNYLEEELDCDLDVDIDNGILAAYCSIEKKSRVAADLQKKVDEVMKVLTDQVEEEEYLGGTRVVVGQGYEVKEVLFPGEFITLFIRNLHPSVTQTELNQHFIVLGLSPTIRSVDMYSYEATKTSVIKFYSKSFAKTALEILKTEPFRGKELNINRAGMGPRKGVTQGEVCRLKLSWALGQSEGIAQVCFHTAKEANSFIDNVGHRFGGARITVVHGEVDSSSSRNGRKLPKHNNAKPQPPAIALRGLPLGACRFRFLDFDDDEQNRAYSDFKLTVVDLPRDIDEQEIFRRVIPVVPKWARVNRKLDPVSQSIYESGISDEELKAKLAPLAQYISTNAYTQFHLDKNLARAVIYMAVDDKIALQKASKMDYGSLMGGNKFGQPYRLEIEYNHTTSIYMDLYKFIKTDIDMVKQIAFTKGAIVWDSADKQNNNNKSNGTRNFKSKFIFIKFRSCNPNLIRQLQQSLENISSCTKFNHEKLHLLFTHTGKLQLDHIAKSTFMFWNARNYGLYIYGSLDVQENVKKQLHDVIDHFSSIEVLDRPLMISKRKLNLAGGKGKPADVAKIERACSASGIGYYDIVGNRVLASGSEKAFSKLKRTLEKDGLLFEKHASHLSRLKVRPDCTICFMPPDSEFVRSSLCHHACCVECIQPLFDMRPPTFPAKCQGQDCQVLMGIGDIVKMAKKESLKTMLEVAVVKYQQQHSTEIFLCPKQECSQLLCSTEKIIGEYGGEFYFCDECVTTYCLPCSLKAEKPVKSHEFDTCEDARNGVSDVVHQHVKTIHETIFNLRCPRCTVAFFEFNGCAAVECGTCNAHFCGLCLKDCGNDAHAHTHVRQCPLNPIKNEYFIKDNALNKIHRGIRVQKLKRYLADIQGEEPQIAESVVRVIRKDLIDLNIEEYEIKSHLNNL